MKKKNFSIVNLALWRFLQKLARQSKQLNARDLTYLTSQELENFLIAPRVNMNHLRQRKRFCVCIVSPRETEVLVGQEAETIAEIVRRRSGKKAVSRFRGILKGQVASTGKAVSIVRVISDTKSIPSMQQGDILVTSMTTPVFVPVLKKASAIITDEGGLTCHAAIVSRELGIPCIIGTKVATKVLKDGDVVEVDAEKGVVRILKQ